MTPPKQKRGNTLYIPSLTGIRALAAILVLGLHTEQNVPIGLDLVLPFFARGYLGVDFFFLLSGFIIAHVYLASLARPSCGGLKIFLWHRFIRLYPVHIAVLAALVAMVLLAKSTGMTLNNPQAWLWSDLVWQFTLLQAWGVTADPTWNAPSWSISAEWFAYLLFPMIAPFMVRVRDAKTALALAIVSIGCTALVFWLAGWTLNTWVGVPALTRVSGEFVCGAALYRVLALWDKPAKSACDILGMGAFVAFLLGASIGVQDFVLIGLLALTIFGAAISRGVLAQNLGSRPLVWLGEISYSIYLVHFPLLLATRRVWEHLGFAEWIIAGRILAFLATVSLVIALAAMLFYVVERPARVRLRDLMGELQ